MVCVGTGLFLAIIDEKTENKIYDYQRKKDEMKKEKGPSLVTKVLVADAILDALDNKKDEKNHKKK